MISLKSLQRILCCVLIVLLIVLALLLAACQSDKSEDKNGPFDADARIESCLGEITVTGESAEERAATYTPLGNGKTFRLYAFRRGETDAQQIVTSYTYTMTDGKPMMDAGQGDGKLYLPYGDMDIYLVGPVSAPSEETDMNGNPVMVSVASPVGVIPRQGIDLIASCTPVTINYTGTNKVNPLPLKHKMAKVRVRVNRNSDKYPKMTSLQLTKVELYNQYEGVGDFTFGEDGGTVQPTPADSVGGVSVVAEGDQIITRITDKEYYADFMLLPRKAGYQKIEVEMNITLNDVPENPYRMSGITRNIEFVGGMQNLLFTEPEVSGDIVWRPELLPWDEEEPVAPPMGGDMILYLDGRDAPEMIDGKRCWRDRSGNGNHAEILSEAITYNAERMCYELPTATDKMQIPALGYIPDYTLEIIAESVPARGTAINFSNTGNDPADARCLYIHLPYDNNNFYYDSGRLNGTADYNPDGRLDASYSGDELFSYSFRTYYFKKSSSTQQMNMGVNGEEKVSRTKTAVHGEFIDNYIGGKENIKIRSVRLYRKYLSDKELNVNYQADKTVYKQEADIAKEGLILYLDGKQPPVTSNDETYWPDLSGKAHHAQFKHVTSGKNFIRHNGKGYEFNNLNVNERSYMELINGSLGTHQSFTFEIICKSVPREKNTMFYSTENTSGNLSQNRALAIHMPWTSGGKRKIYFDCPLETTDPPGRFDYIGPLAEAEYLAQFHYHAFQREETNSTTGQADTRYYSDGVFIYSSQLELKNKAMNKTVIGYGLLGGNSGDWMQGEILAIRLYDRVLTPEEILKNSRSDKARYKY